MTGKRLFLALVVAVGLGSMSCGSAEDRSLTSGFATEPKLRNMRPTAFVATMAMNALLQSNPEMDEDVLAKRAYDIADAMVLEAMQREQMD
jgi:hypothetical protein